jgi:hypothetical protein
MTFRYVQTFTFSINAGVAAEQIMRLNSLNDPDVTNAGGAHQPYGHDQLVALYARYRVMKTWCRVVLSPSSASYHAVFIPTNGSLAVTIADQATYQTAAESPRARHWIQGASGQSKRLAFTISLNDLNGTTIEEYSASDRTQAQVGANPVELLQLAIGVLNPNAETIVVNIELEMRFICEVWDPILLAGS